MTNLMPNRCSAVDWPSRACKHGHAVTTACVYPEHGTPTCCREDLVFDERKQAVTLVRIDAAARFAEWKAQAQEDGRHG